MFCLKNNIYNDCSVNLETVFTRFRNEHNRVRRFLTKEECTTVFSVLPTVRYKLQPAASRYYAITILRVIHVYVYKCTHVGTVVTGRVYEEPEQKTKNTTKLDLVRLLFAVPVVQYKREGNKIQKKKKKRPNITNLTRGSSVSADQI